MNGENIEKWAKLMCVLVGGGDKGFILIMFSFLLLEDT